MKWIVIESTHVAEELKKYIKNKEITIEDIRIIKKWAEIMESDGPLAIQEQKIWDDHPLFKEWQGYRSSSFSYRGRIIYRIEDKKIKIYVVKITPSHDYKKDF